MAHHHHHSGQPQPSATASTTPSQSPSSILTPSVTYSSPNKVPINARHYQQIMTGDVNSLTNENISHLECESDNSTALHIAAMAGKDELISILPRNHELLFRPNSRDDLPVHVAVRCAHQSTVLMMLMNSSVTSVCEMLEAKNEDKNTPLHIALENQQEKMAMELFAKCPHTFYRLNSQGISPLYLAIKAGCWQLVHDMLHKLDQVDADDLNQLGRGRSVVHAVIMANNLEILTKMMDNYIYDDIEYSLDEKGRTPLSYAAYIGFHDGVKYLLEKYPEQAFKTDMDGSFPIHKACSGGYINVVEKFFSCSRHSRRLLNSRGQSILHVAAESGQAEVVNYILRRDLENLINMQDIDGNTALHLGAMGKHPKVVYVLTWDDRVRLNLQNKDGFTALDLAEHYGDVPSFRERLSWLALRYAGVPRAPLSIDTQTVELDTTTNIPNNYNINGEFSYNGYIQAVKMHNPLKVGKNKYKDRLNTLLMVSTLVATVTFASGFTVPGGYNNDNPDQGMATLAHKCAFQVFIISNTIAMYSSILAVVTLIWAHLDDLRLISLSLDFAVPLLGIALTMMSVAFMAGLYVVLHNRFWLGLVVLAIGGGFLGALLLFIIPFYSCASCALKYKILRYVFHLPFALMLLASENGNCQTLY